MMKKLPSWVWGVAIGIAAIVVAAIFLFFGV
jgi:hypothetical protein